MARIVIRQGGKQEEHRIGGTMTIGRQSTNDIVVLEEKASRVHARIIPSGRQFIVEDLNSSNGTFLNGVKIQRHVLKQGDEIRIGGLRLTFFEDKALNLEGQILGGKYRVQEKIGAGGMGAVYRATQVSMQRVVALKVLKDELAQNPAFVRAFLQEARAAGRLNHPNIVKVHDFGGIEGTYYFSMEYVDGESLEDFLQREGKVYPERAMDIVLQVAKALQHAQEHKILHRDIKPQNILTDKQGKVKLTDLGLARVVTEEGSERRRAIVGTPHYMAPEVAQQKKTDIRSDIYSLGATLFHMLTGRVPYAGSSSLSVITKHIHQPVPSPRQFDVTIPEPVCRLAERMMAKNPGLRPSSARELVAEIEAIKEKLGAAPKKPARPGLPAKPATAPVRPMRVSRAAPSGPSPVVYVLIGALGVGVLGLVGFALMMKGRGAPSGGERAGVSSRRGTGRYGRGTASRSPRTSSGQRFPGTRVATREVRPVDHEALASKSLEHARTLIREGAKTYAPRILLRLIREHPRTKAAREARELLEELYDGKMPPEVRQMLGSGGRLVPTPSTGGGTRVVGPGEVAVVGAGGKVVMMGAPRGPVEETASAAFEKARARAVEAESRGEFRTAHIALAEFMRRYKGSVRADDAKGLLDRLDQHAGHELSMKCDRAASLIQSGRYAEASSLLREIIRVDPVGASRKRAESLLKPCTEGASDLKDDVMDRLRPLIASGKFGEASMLIREAARVLEGTGVEDEVAALAGPLEAAASFLESLRGKSLPLGAGVRIRVKSGGRTISAPVLRAAQEGLRVRDGPVERLVKWGDVSGDDALMFFEGLRLSEEDRLGAGAFFVLRSEAAPARAILQPAVDKASTRIRALDLMGSFDARFRPRRFDFTTFDDAEAWDLRGTWTVSNGKLFHAPDPDSPEGDAAEGVACLRGRSFRADGLDVAFEVAFVDTDGALEVMLGEEGASSLWFSIGGAGYKARADLDGSSAEARTQLVITSMTLYEVSCVMLGDTLAVEVSGRRMEVLSAPGLGRVSGPLTFRAQGVRLALDEIAIRQVGQ